MREKVYNGGTLPDYIFNDHFDKFYAQKFDDIIYPTGKLEKLISSLTSQTHDIILTFSCLETYLDVEELNKEINLELSGKDLQQLLDKVISEGYRSIDMEGVINSYNLRDVLRTALLTGSTKQWVVYFNRDIELVLIGVNEGIAKAFAEMYAPYQEVKLTDILNDIFNINKEKLFINQLIKNYFPNENLIIKRFLLMH